MSQPSKDDATGIEPVWLNPKQAAALTGFTVGALAEQRHERRGPRYIKVGKLVRYKRTDLLRWVESGGTECGFGTEAPAGDE